MKVVNIVILQRDDEETSIIAQSDMRIEDTKQLVELIEDLSL